MTAPHKDNCECEICKPWTKEIVLKVREDSPFKNAGDIQGLIQERDNWIETARRSQKDCDYYQRLLDEIGEAIGEEAYISDDGSVQDSVLRAKVPELAIRIIKQWKDVREVCKNPD